MKASKFSDAQKAFILTQLSQLALRNGDFGELRGQKRESHQRGALANGL